jgi:hypothetical protein
MSEVAASKHLVRSSPIRKKQVAISYGGLTPPEMVIASEFTNIFICVPQKQRIYTILLLILKRLVILYKMCLNWNEKFFYRG